MDIHRSPDLSPLTLITLLMNDITKKPNGTGVALPSPAVVSSVTQPLRVAEKLSVHTRTAYPGPPGTSGAQYVISQVHLRRIVVDVDERFKELFPVIQCFDSHFTKAAEASPTQAGAWVRWIYMCSIYMKTVK